MDHDELIGSFTKVKVLPTKLNRYTPKGSGVVLRRPQNSGATYTVQQAKQKKLKATKAPLRHKVYPKTL